MKQLYPQKFIPGRNPLLELCPFCGEPAEISQDKEGEFIVTCCNSDCPFKPSSRKANKTEELAIKTWNTRKGGT
jgi:hypothetical protein